MLNNDNDLFYLESNFPQKYEKIINQNYQDLARMNIKSTKSDASSYSKFSIQSTPVNQRY